MTETEPTAGGTRRFLGNAGWLLAGEVVAKAANFIFVVILARGLGTIDYGYFTFAVSFFPLFLMISTWGLNVALIREIARAPQRFSNLFSSGLVVRLAFGIVAYGVALAIVPLLSDTSAPSAAVALVGAALLIDEVTSFLGSAFKAFERMARHAIVLIINRVATTALTAVVFLAGGDLFAVAGVYLLGSLLALAAGWIVLKRGLPPVRLRDTSLETVRELLRLGSPLGVAAVLNTAAFRIDAALLQAIKGPAAVAMYGVGYRFFESFLFVAWSLATVALPRLSRQSVGPAASRAIQQPLAFTLAFYLPIAAAAPFVSEWIVVGIFSEEYAPAARVVPWLTAAAALYAVAHLFRHGIIAIGYRRAVPLIAAGTLVVNLAGNAFAIPKYGFLGAGVVTFGTELFEAVMSVGVFVRRNGVGTLDRIVLVPVIAAAAMAGTLLLFDLRDAGAVIVGSAVYLVLVAAGAALMSGDVRAALKNVSSRSAPADAIPDNASDL